MIARAFTLVLSVVLLIVGLRMRHNPSKPTAGPWDHLEPARPPPALGAREKEHRAASPGLTRSDGYRIAAALVGLLVLVQFMEWFVGRTFEVLIIVFVATVLAIVFRPAVEALHRSPIPFTNWRLPRVFWMLMIYVGIGMLFAIFGAIVVPQVIAEVESFIKAHPEYTTWITTLASDLLEGKTVPSLSALGGNLQQIIGNVISYAFQFLGFLAALAGGIASVVLIFVLAVFLVITADRIIDYFVYILPDSRQEQARGLLGLMGDKIAGWAIGTLILSGFVGGASTIGLLALGMPYAFLLGIFAGLAELIPFLGPWIGAAPAVLVALFQPTWKLIAVILLYLAIQEAEGHIVAPTVLGRSLRMPAIVVLLAVIFGAALYGIVGALLAVPFTAIMQVLFNDFIIPEIKKAQRNRSE